MRNPGLPMRLSFPNGEHPDIVIEQGQVGIGSAPGNRVVIKDAGLAASHARFRIDPQRGIVLGLEPGVGAAYVNARPVRELAFLRLGDKVSLSRLQILLKPDDEHSIVRELPLSPAAISDPGQRVAASRVVLRGIAGAFHGRTFSLLDPLVIGRNSDADIRLDEPGIAERHAKLEQHSDRVVLRDLGSHEGSVVNGVALKNAVLHPGDQIAYEQHRFVLEAPGLPPRGSITFAITRRTGAAITQPLQAVQAVPSDTPVPSPSVVSEPRFNYWWLLGTAAAIAALLAGILLYAPR